MCDSIIEHARWSAAWYLLLVTVLGLVADAVGACRVFYDSDLDRVRGLPPGFQFPGAISEVLLIVTVLVQKGLEPVLPSVLQTLGPIFGF